jgi:hypothetical protein
MAGPSLRGRSLNAQDSSIPPAISGRIGASVSNKLHEPMHLVILVTAHVHPLCHLDRLLFRTPARRHRHCPACALQSQGRWDATAFATRVCGASGRSSKRPKLANTSRRPSTNRERRPGEEKLESAAARSSHDPARPRSTPGIRAKGSRVFRRKNRNFPQAATKRSPARVEAS